ncbi:hypothetical protein [Bradyrhizobium sp. 157]|uniref:hypothetical protein n=1 Tax=Bradyrhizobium sp. 157 TaxID=2782631 RepID=UPI001FF872A7|nr:hypothetical protein [Bradyrhizobium sp. 157]
MQKLRLVCRLFGILRNQLAQQLFRLWQILLACIRVDFLQREARVILGASGNGIQKLQRAIQIAISDLFRREHRDRVDVGRIDLICALRLTDRAGIVVGAKQNDRAQGMELRVRLVAFVGGIDDPKRGFGGSTTQHNSCELQSRVQIVRIQFDDAAQIQEERTRLCPLVDACERPPDFDLVALVLDCFQEFLSRLEVVLLFDKSHSALIVTLRAIFGRSAARYERHEQKRKSAANVKNLTDWLLHLWPWITVMRPNAAG